MDEIKYRIVFLALFVGAALLVAGCSVTMPASERIMFQYKEQPQSNDRLFEDDPKFQPVHRERQPPVSFTPFDKLYFSFSASPLMKNELTYAKDKFSLYVQEKMEEPDIQEEDFSIANPYNIAFSAPITLTKSPSFALSGNLGVPVLGMDMTAKTFENTFLTANMSYLSGELIFQHRLLNKKKIGISLGPHFRMQRRWLQVIEGPDESFGISTIFSILTPARTYYNKTLGLRSVFYLPMEKNSYLHAVVAPGYSLNMQQPVLTVGVSLHFEL